jgi:UDP-glucose 4-epimerase
VFDLVTGGAGFIGSHLVDRLVSEGRKVRVIDNFSNGSPRNLAQYAGDSKVEVVIADVADAASLKGLFSGAERVFHLAALADIVPSIQRPRAYFEANVDGTFNVLEQASAAHVRRLVYAASSSCYGIPDTYPTSEAAPIRPQYPYALTKYLGEQLVLHWAQVYKLPALSLRLFNVYGPRARTSGTYGAVFGVFLAQLLARKPLTIVGDGSQTRDFTFVADVVDAFVTAAESDKVGEIFNVGSRNTYEVRRLVELLAPERIEYIPKRPGEPDCTWADVSKIERDLNWRAKVSFEDGVGIMKANIDYWRDAPVWTPASIADATKEWFTYLGKD